MPNDEHEYDFDAFPLQYVNRNFCREETPAPTGLKVDRLQRPWDVTAK